jgi:hypothetical protein
MHIRVSQFAWQQTSKQKPYGPTESDMNFHSTEGEKKPANWDYCAQQSYSL